MLRLTSRTRTKKNGAYAKQPTNEDMVGKEILTLGFLRETQKRFRELTLQINSHENEPVVVPDSTKRITIEFKGERYNGMDT